MVVLAVLLTYLATSVGEYLYRVSVSKFGEKEIVAAWCTVTGEYGCKGYGGHR